MGWDNINSNYNILTMAVTNNDNIKKNVIDRITSPKFNTGSFFRQNIGTLSENGLRDTFSKAEKSASIFEEAQSAINTKIGHRGFFKTTGDFIKGNSENLINTRYNKLIQKNLLSGKSVEEAVSTAKKSIESGNIGLAAKIRVGSKKATSSVLSKDASTLAKEITEETQKGLVNATKKSSGGILSKAKKHAGTLLYIGSQIVAEAPKVKKAFKEGGFFNGIKQIFKSTVQIGLTEGLTALATGLVGMIPIVGPAIATSGVVSFGLNMFLYSPCQKIAEAVTSLPVFKVKGVETDTEATNELKELGYSEEEINAACEQTGVQGAAELKELIDSQAGTTQQNTTANAAAASSNGAFSSWLTNQTMSMNPSTGIYS